MADRGLVGGGGLDELAEGVDDADGVERMGEQLIGAGGDGIFEGVFVELAGGEPDLAVVTVGLPLVADHAGGGVAVDDGHLRGDDDQPGLPLDGLADGLGAVVGGEAGHVVDRLGQVLQRHEDVRLIVGDEDEIAGGHESRLLALCLGNIGQCGDTLNVDGSGKSGLVGQSALTGFARADTVAEQKASQGGEH